MLVGHGSSGTSALFSSLGLDRQVTSFPEGDPVVYDGTRLDLERLVGVLDRCRPIVLVKPLGDALERTPDEILGRLSDHLPGVEVRVVVLVRHPGAVLGSVARRGWSEGAEADLAEWARQARDAAVADPRIIVVRFEDLVSDRSLFDDLAAHLGITGERLFGDHAASRPRLGRVLRHGPQAMGRWLEVSRRARRDRRRLGSAVRPDRPGEPAPTLAWTPLRADLTEPAAPAGAVEPATTFGLRLRTGPAPAPCAPVDRIGWLVAAGDGRRTLWIGTLAGSEWVRGLTYVMAVVLPAEIVEPPVSPSFESSALAVVTGVDPGAPHDLRVVIDRSAGRLHLAVDGRWAEPAVAWPDRSALPDRLGPLASPAPVVVEQRWSVPIVEAWTGQG